MHLEVSIPERVSDDFPGFSGRSRDHAPNIRWFQSLKGFRTIFRLCRVARLHRLPVSIPERVSDDFPEDFVFRRQVDGNVSIPERVSDDFPALCLGVFQAGYRFQSLKGFRTIFRQAAMARPFSDRPQFQSLKGFRTIFRLHRSWRGCSKNLVSIPERVSDDFPVGLGFKICNPFEVSIPERVSDDFPVSKGYRLWKGVQFQSLKGFRTIFRWC